MEFKIKRKNKNYNRFNKHIDFEREGKKSSARKRPTEVTCVKCRKKVILPFKPRNPEVYCADCFKKKKR